MTGILVYSDEGLRLFPRGFDNDTAKIHWRNFKIIFRNIQPISPKLCWHESRATSFSRGDRNEIAYLKYIGEKSKKIVNLLNHWTNFNQTWRNASFCDGDSSFISTCKGQFYSQKGDNDFKCTLLIACRLSSLSIFSKTARLISTKLVTKGEGIQVYSNEGPHPFPKGVD